MEERGTPLAEAKEGGYEVFFILPLGEKVHLLMRPFTTDDLKYYALSQERVVSSQTDKRGGSMDTLRVEEIGGEMSYTIYRPI